MMHWASNPFLGPEGPRGDLHMDGLATIRYRERERELHKGVFCTNPDFDFEDGHRRTANDVEADRLIAARRTLLLRFLPFVRLEDQNLSPVDLLLTVARRLLDEADAIRATLPAERVVSTNPHGMRHDPFDFHSTV